MPVSTISQAGLDAPISLTSPTLTTPNIDSAQIPTVSGTAPLYMCRAWVNFNGTGTVAIRASGNVTSITDNGVGDYTVNFTTAMPDANYSVLSAAEGGGSVGNPPYQRGNYPITSTSSIRVTFFTYNAGLFVDPTYCCVAIIR
jgi:hypothetical protein